MSHLSISILVFVSVTASAFLGLWLRNVLPSHHLLSESIDAIKLATGLIATLAALVLGLLVSSSKHSMDDVNGELIRNAASIMQLDRILQDYGSAAEPLRQEMIRDYGATVALLSTNEPVMVDEAYMQSRLQYLQDYQLRVMALPAGDDTHKQLRAAAAQLQGQISATRWLVALQRDGSISVPLLIVLLIWLLVIFAAFGLVSPRNGAVIVGLVLCAVSASGAVFLILEMDRPLDGLVRISVRPLRDALERLTQ